MNYFATAGLANNQAYVKGFDRLIDAQRAAVSILTRDFTATTSRVRNARDKSIVFEYQRDANNPNMILTVKSPRRAS